MVQRALERYISQRTIQRVLAAGQQSRTLDLLEIQTAFHAVLTFQCGTRLLQVAEGGRADELIQSVAVIIRASGRRSTPVGYRVLAVFSEVRKGNNIARLVVVAAFVGDPDLNLIDRESARYIRHTRHRLFVVVAEEMTQEEMSILVVVIAADVELRSLCAALAAHRLRLTVLLRNQCLDLQLAELQVRLDTEQRLAAPNQRTRQVHRYVSGLNRLDDIVLFAFVVELQVLLVEREGGLGVVTHVEVQLLTHLTLDARLDLLVEIENIVVARA